MFDITKETASTSIPIWQGKNIEVAQGGFTLEDSFSAGEIIPAGVPIGYDESTRKAKVAKIAVMQANANNSATEYKVLKNHVLKVGMSVKSGSASAQTITKIDKSESDYDTITLSATLGSAVNKDKFLFVEDEGYSNAKGLLYSPVMIGNNKLASVTVVLRGTVYERRIAPIPSELKEKMPTIIFSQSY